MPEFTERLDRTRPLLKSLLVTSTAEKEHIAPRQVDKVHYAILRGTLDHSGVEADVERRDVHGNRRREMYDNSRAFEKAVEPNGELNQDIKEDVTALTHAYPRMTATEMGECQIDFHWKHSLGGLQPALLMQQTFPLPHRLVTEVEEEILPSYRESELEDVVGIGTAMRPYV